MPIPIGSTCERLNPGRLRRTLPLVRSGTSELYRYVAFERFSQGGCLVPDLRVYDDPISAGPADKFPIL